MSTIKAVLIAARDLIDKHGHAIGDQVWSEGCPHGYCIVTACGKAGRDMKVSSSTDAILAFRYANGIQKSDGIGTWSDTHTKAEVLAAFDKTIEATP